MTTATYHPGTGLGQDVWSQAIQQQYGQQPFGQQPFGPIGVPGQGTQQFTSPVFQPQQPWQQPFGQPAGQQILAVLPALIAQQAQQLYAIAQVCAQLAPVPTQQYGIQAHQFGLPQFGQGQQGLPGQQGFRSYPMGY